MNPNAKLLSECKGFLGPCIPRHGTYKANFTSHESVVMLTMYPSFNLIGSGVTSMLFPEFYSPQFNNTRPIALYKPWSILENTVSRAINILVVLDGDVSIIDMLTTSSGNFRF